jgi:SpoVK/Ycf46/Vps4 family AAA+-type ATPase
MTLNQARQSIASALIEDGVLDVRDIDQIHDRKAKMIRDEGLLEFFPTLDNDFRIGGFGNLKSWLHRAALGFTPQAKDLNLSPPRGIMLTGVQGCGKSLAAKAVAREWNTPLLKLDASSLYDKYIGETESNLRKALRLAESLSPVILWIDEIEKAFATGDGSTDGGTSMRVLGNFLTWLQEKKDSIFVVATSNDLSILPPELLRKGRFDEIFFVDLPEANERREIFEIHLRLKKQDPAAFNLDSLVVAAGGFSGAEIEQVIVASLYRALFLKRELNTDLLMGEIVDTVPLSVTRSEDIERLRKHARTRFVPAASSRANLELTTAG